jgi:phosphate transport system substrate-binding protein
MKKIKINLFSIFSILAISLYALAPAFSGDLSIKGSTTALPIVQKVAEAYMAEHPDVAISLSGGGSGNGIKAILDKSTDIATASRFIKEKETATAFEKGIYPVPFAIAYDSIIPVVHPDNPLTDLSLDQLRRIYNGSIRNFKELGGPDLKIVVNSRDTSSGTWETWNKKVMKKERVTPRAQALASNGAIVQAVANNRHAIGYIGIGYLTPRVKALHVNGIEGNETTTLSGAFPISRPLFMFTSGWPQGDVLNFINFMLNPAQGQKYVSESGYVKLY